MYGGIKYDAANETDETENSFQSFVKQTTNELWSFNLQTNKWLLMNFAESKKSPEFKNYALPIAVSGHSMHLVKKSENLSSIFIFFGYSEYYGSTLNIIQEFNIGE